MVQDRGCPQGHTAGQPVSTVLRTRTGHIHPHHTGAGQQGAELPNESHCARNRDRRPAAPTNLPAPEEGSQVPEAYCERDPAYNQRAGAKVRYGV